MRSQSLVLFDADARRREALAFGLRRAALAVHATDQPAEAIAHGLRADVVVIEVGAEGDAAPDAAPLGQLLPPLLAATHRPALLVVGTAELREPAMAAGADQFLLGPAEVHDLLTMARLAIAVRSGARQLDGEIEDYGLFHVTRALRHARRSATVLLERSGGPRGRTGELRFSRGSLVAARASRQHGPAAFLQLLLWESGTIRIRFGEPERDERPLTRSTDALLADGERFIAEFRDKVLLLGGPDAVYARSDRKLASERAQLPRQVLEFLELVDGSRRVLDLVEDGAFKPFDTLAILDRLAKMRAIGRRKGAGSTNEKSRRAGGAGSPGARREPEQGAFDFASAQGVPCAVDPADERTGPADAPEDEVPELVSLADASDLMTQSSSLDARLTHAEPAPRVTRSRDAAYWAPTREVVAQPRTRDVPIPKSIPIERSSAVRALSGSRVRADGAARAERPVSSPGTPIARPASRKPPTPPPSSRATTAPGLRRDTGRFGRFDPLDEEFFSREDEATRVDPVDSFDDLEPASGDGAAKAEVTRTWFGLRTTRDGGNSSGGGVKRRKK